MTRISEGSGGWRYQRNEDGDKFLFNTTGKLLTHTQRNGWVMTYSYNDVSQLTKITNHFGRSLGLAYNAAGQISSITPPDDSTTNYEYDSAGRLSAVRYPGNTSKTYHYEIAAFPRMLTGITDENNIRLATYTYDAQGRATATQQAASANRYQVTYPASTGAATQVTDPLGTTRTYNYATNLGKLAVTSADKPSGIGLADAARRIQDANGLITAETDFLGVQTMYTWDISRRLPLSTTQAAGRPEAQTSSTQWHPTFRLPTLVTEQGRTTAYTYDAQGNKLTQVMTDAVSGSARTWAWTYNTAGLVATSTDPKGGVTSYAYNAQGNATSMTNPLGHVSTYGYDAAGRIASQTEPNGLASSYTYDARGRLLTATTGSGAALEATTYTYHPTGQLATAVLPSGYSSAYTYDAAQRLVAAVDNRGNRIDYTLDAMGNRLREEVKDPGGNIVLLTRRAVNQLNRVSSLQTAQNQTTNIGFDLNGDAISQTDPLNQTTRQTLDGLRRPVATTFADNSAASQNYNQLDQLTSVTDPKGVATSYTRNAFGEVVAEASADMGSISYQRNAAGEVTGSTDANGNNTQITRDALGRPLTVTRTSPTGTTAHVTTYTYDTGSTGAQTGYLAKMQDPSGSTTYQRDSFGRITSKTQTINDNPAAPGTYTTRYSYAKGDLASITYPSGLKAIYTRSPSGQVTAISTQVPGLNKPITPFASNITYTALGQPKAWSWASGDAAARTFDADGRMVSNEFAGYSFDAASRISGITQSLWASRTVTQVIGTATSVVTQLYPTPLSWTAAYDNRNRLTGFNRAGSTSGFTYDANSNRLTAISKTTSDTDLDNDFDALDTSSNANQAVTLAANSNRQLGFTQTLTKVQGTRTLATTNSTVNYALDANGNLLSDGLRTFDYDAANRHSQTTVTKDGEASKITYLHNGQGQRVFKSEPQVAQTIPDAATLGTPFVTWLKNNFQWLFAAAQTNATLGQSYVYADADAQLPSYAVLGEYGNGGAQSAGRIEYLWLPLESGDAMPIGIYQNAKFYAVHSDHLNTPRQVTDNTNKPVWQWPYSAFGDNKPTGILSPTANPANAYTQDQTSLSRLQATNPPLTYNPRYPGQYFDSESNLSYNTFRTYSAGQGRYTQNDPIGLAGGLNRFGYVGGNALWAYDPLGLVEYAGLGTIQAHLERLARTQGDSFYKDPWYGPERAMLERLRRGEGSSYDVAFYHHEKAEADMCLPYKQASNEKYLEKQREAHREVERNQRNTQIDHYHPEVRRRFSDLFPIR